MTNSLILITYILLGACICLRIIYALYFLPRVRKSLGDHSNSRDVVARNIKLSKVGIDTLYIVTPVYKETSIFPKLANRLQAVFGQNKQVVIVFVTTEKEFLNQDPSNSVENTVALAKEYSAKHENVRHIHYPYINLSLAEQMNYALRTISEKHSGRMETIYFGVYNADSDPSPNTLSVLERMIQKYPNTHIFQQSSAFFSNINLFKKNPILAANALRQTRWTFLYEIPRYIRDFPDFLNLQHVVSHGLFVRGDILQKVNFFPTDSFGEDLYLGFILHAFGFKIGPLPVLENSESPSSNWAMLRQKYVWFWGPYGYFYYWLRIREHFPQIWENRRFIIITTTLLGIADALNWLLAGSIYVLFVILGFHIGVNYGVLALALISVYFLYTCIYTLVIYDEQCDQRVHIQISSLNKLLAITLYPVIVLVHGIPPIVSIAMDWKIRITKQAYIRPKTERV